MKRVLVISDDETHVYALEEILKLQFEVMHYKNEIDDTPDLVLVVVEDHSSELFSAQKVIGSRYPHIPVLFLWVEEDCFRILTYKNFRHIHGKTIPKANDSLLEQITASISRTGGNGTLENPQHLTDIQSDIRKSYQTFRGAIQVQYDDFMRIYQFVELLTERTGKCVQTLLLSLVPCKGLVPTNENLMNALDVLSEAVQVTLRKNDVLTDCSQSQMLVLLVDADDAGGHLATNRIINTFLGLYDENIYELHYDIRPIGKQ